MLMQTKKVSADWRLQDYYPFGMLMPGRKLSLGEYKFGFNGKENDDEVKGLGNWQDYGMRIYDPRLGRFQSVDPLTRAFSWYSPYQFSGNKPIWAIDLDGEEEKIYQSTLKDHWGFKASLAIADLTTIGKEFNEVLKSQNKVDVYYYTFESKEMLSDGSIVSGVQYETDGFAIGYGGLGTTGEVSNKTDLTDYMNTVYQAQSINPADLEKSFSQGKKVVLIGVAKQLLDVPAGFTLEQQKNLRISSTEVVVHEENAHAQNIIEGIKKEPQQEHKEFHGEESHQSPSAKDLLTNKKYENTTAGKVVKEIKSLVDKVFRKK